MRTTSVWVWAMAWGMTSGGPAKDMLDGMQVLLTGSGTFDEDFYAEFVGCLDQFDPRIMGAVDAQWAGMLEYANAGGNPEEGDPWEPCPEERWIENNCTTQEYGQVPIYEPCNYASNIAYYHTAVEVCKREAWQSPPDFVKAELILFALLGQGSGFFHGSQTDVGGISDVRLNDLLGYLTYQMAVANLPPFDNPIIHHLNDTAREMTAVEITEYLIGVYTDAPVADLGDILLAIDMPGIEIGMCAILETAASIIFDDETFYRIIESLLPFFDALYPGMAEFCAEKFAPTILDATNHIVLTDEEKTSLTNKVLGVVIKLVYACVWQEEIFGENTPTSPEANEQGMALLPLVNAFASQLTDYDYYNRLLQTGRNMYPGGEWCNIAPIPHAKWHLQTGIALTDLVFLADEFAGYLR